MITPLAAAVVPLAAAGLLLAGPAAAQAAPSDLAQQIGYVGVPTTFHNAGVTVRVPTLTCTSASAYRSVSIGLFASESQAGVVRPFSLTIDETCNHGSVHYRAVYRNHGAGGGMPVHRGDVVRLTLNGVGGFGIDDHTSGRGSGGASGGSGSAPKAERPVLFGVQRVGPRPGGLHVNLSQPKVNHTALHAVKHHKHGGRSANYRVGKLAGGRFPVTFRAKHPH
ncbi:hypothetical protein [Jatrophihabitans endophyticus]|uniref:hypothetical protein n=1 Tax=Jatrophihabitans endophyticus TaxID=1206085 RepID=UPI0019E75EB0|nr:hypothetical protein [Jatrophihabitans endophyticus]MBE7189441.1 hypothetical protein [Jatrophihabitans endophyticus]